ncbi:MAG TPA: erythromycin esterase family protein [Thermoanaerobaculia bacterium]|nr:erythromycin esterase family protein [Thermoanaerobaculia bacterium]
MRKALFLLAACVLAWVPSAQADPRPYLDLDFELPECSVGWSTVGLSQVRHEKTLDRTVVQSGAQSVRIRYMSPLPWSSRLTGVNMSRTFDPAEVAGKRVRLSGYIRTEGLTSPGAYASLFWTGVAPSASVVEESAAAQGTTPWTRHELEIDIPADVTRNTFGMFFYGNGTVWFDNLQVEVDGKVIHQGPAPDLGGPPPGHGNWLRSRVIPFDTPVAGSGFADLQPLKPVIGDARIVSLGEATHGTREFFQMKHRLLEFLVEERGFTHFSIEAGVPEAARINDYVLTGEGDPGELLEGLRYVPWKTQEVLDLILWMRAYNASGRGPVQFTGFDMQIASGAAENLRAFLAQAEPAYLAQAESVFTRMIAIDALHRARATAADSALAQGFFDHLSANRGAYLAAGLSAEKVDWAIQNARVLVQLAELWVTAATNPSAASAVRDLRMADNVQWILDHAPSGSKIVLWAHNGHVRKAPGLMGHHLDQRYGEDMYVLGLTFGEGSYNANSPFGWGVIPHEAAVTAPNSLESLLADTGIPRFIVDLGSLGADGPARWFHETRRMREHGATAHRCSLWPTVAALEYDGLIWFDQTTPSVRLSLD